MEDKNRKEFISGFNKGYIIRKYDKELHESLAESLRSKEDSYSLIQGMIKGAEEADLEIQIDELGSLRDDNKELDLDL